jgi:hypothetical protein
MQVFVTGSNAAADMPLRLVLFKNIANPPVKLRIQGPQPIGHILMYCGLGYMKLPRGSTYRRVVLNNVFAQLNGPLLYCSLHVITS